MPRKTGGSKLATFSHGKTGKSRLEVDQQELFCTIAKTVESTGTSDDRRRSKLLHTVKTMVDSSEKMVQMCFKLSRSAKYLQVQPQYSDSRIGKRHVQTVPIELLRCENNLHKININQMFVKYIGDDLHEICKLFGTPTVLHLSDNNKARVPVGLSTALLQAPILMHLEYEVKLSDRSFVLAQRHALMPSIYGLCELKPNGDLSYTDNTLICV